MGFQFIDSSLVNPGTVLGKREPKRTKLPYIVATTEAFRKWYLDGIHYHREEYMTGNLFGDERPQIRREEEDKRLPIPFESYEHLPPSHCSEYCLQKNDFHQTLPITIHIRGDPESSSHLFHDPATIDIWIPLELCPEAAEECARVRGYPYPAYVHMMILQIQGCDKKFEFKALYTPIEKLPKGSLPIVPGLRGQGVWDNLRYYWSGYTHEFDDGPILDPISGRPKSIFILKDCIHRDNLLKLSGHYIRIPQPITYRYHF
ncbi:hypothetical protein TWF481_007516 [Arthrobotrys musiformis]|uniref:Uncharacterized protein n=1 Tax=Arthrobotrys musiformis TaxID=47236 RepID=A0AAV9WCQ6_9PEZI